MKKPPVLEAEIVESQWDKKKIAIGVISLILLTAGTAYGKYLYTEYSKPSHILSVQGVNTVSLPDELSPTPANASHFALPSSQDVGNTVSNQIQKLQDQVSAVNVQEIATTTPQIQAILEQIQKLPDVPGVAAKQACEQICKGL